MNSSDEKKKYIRHKKKLHSTYLLSIRKSNSGMQFYRKLILEECIRTTEVST